MNVLTLYASRYGRDCMAAAIRLFMDKKPSIAETSLSLKKLSQQNYQPEFIASTQCIPHL